MKIKQLFQYIKPVTGKEKCNQQQNQSSIQSALYEDNFEDWRDITKSCQDYENFTFVSKKYNKYKSIISSSVPLFICIGDISKIKCDAVVNAAHVGLSGGSGVDGAIHIAAGPELGLACAKIGNCAPGEVVMTDGYNSLAKKIIHTVGPVYKNGKCDEADILRNCYRNSLELCIKNDLWNVAFPAISCGHYGYPSLEGIEIAIEVVSNYIKKYPRLRVGFVVNNQIFEVFKAYDLQHEKLDI